MDTQKPIQGQHNEPAVVHEPRYWLITALAVIAAALVVGGGVWWWMNGKIESERRATEQLTVADSSDVRVGWQTYRSESLGFSFQYPSEYEIQQDALPEERPDFTASPSENLTLVNASVPEEPTLTLYMNTDGFGPYFPDVQYRYEQQGNALVVGERTVPEPSSSNPEDVMFVAVVADWQDAGGQSNQFRIHYRYQNTGVDYEEEFVQILSTFRFLDDEQVVSTEGRETYQHDEPGFAFEYNPVWLIVSDYTSAGIDYTRPLLFVSAGTTSDELCEGLGCAPRSGDREGLTARYTLEGAPPLHPTFTMLRVHGTSWVSIQLTDTTKTCTSESDCEAFLAGAPFEEKSKASGSEYTAYNNFIDMLSTLSFTE
ncbi:MAG: hypothetical protein U1C18_01835 [Patescibacteria group bacterium]|nr:hypothetical protein [bacterium]MDZ4221593.1 hypothetical protein [Patescibacteria group bacterium]